MLGGSDGGGAQEQQSKRDGIVITPTSLPLAPDRGDSCIEVYGRWRQTLENPIYLRRTTSDVEMLPPENERAHFRE